MSNPDESDFTEHTISSRKVFDGVLIDKREHRGGATS
jgi:hypothetical protein